MEANFGKNSEISSSSQQLSKPNLGQNSSNCRCFSLAEVRLATNNFDETLVVGHGGFGKVYKGVIDDGMVTVAMKRLSSTSKQGAPQFWTEVQLLSKFRHSHLVSLIGYCNNRDEMILVYEYMARGSLADHLYKVHPNGNNNTLTLSWVERLKICIGAAQGLDYLHTGTGIHNRVIHRDFKSSNILLDDSWAAKVSDFGLSKIGPANQATTHVSTNVKGTFGYLDPEYLMTHRLTRKSDVYSFGVVLLEVLSGRRAVDLKLCEEQWGLVGWAKECIKKGEVDLIIDRSLKWQILPSSLTPFVHIADRCLHYRSKKRPTMAEVVASLESALALQERRDSSMFEEDFLNLGGTFDNQENSDDSLGKSEVINTGNGEYQAEEIHNVVLQGGGHSEATTRNGSNKSKEGDSRNDSECVEEDEPGVYITLIYLPGGVKDLKRIRFSRRRYSTVKQAEQWWVKNKARVYEQYNVRMVDKSSVGVANDSLGQPEVINTGNGEHQPEEIHNVLLRGGGHSEATTRNGSNKSEEGDSRNDSEWVEKDEPGVYIVLTSLPGGLKDIKRVRFSRRRFSEIQAEQWCVKNRSRVYKQYT